MNTKKLKILFIVSVIIIALAICIVAVVAGSIPSHPTSPVVTVARTASNQVNRAGNPTFVTPTSKILTSTPSLQPVPTHVDYGVTPDASGIYYGDYTSSEETQTFLEITPWVIVWKCSDSVGSMMFTLDDNHGSVMKIYGPYHCTTQAQSIVIHQVGLFRVGAIPLDMDGAYFYGIGYAD
ncbi:MAG: hypothetical protein WCD86_01275 [Ktedonobacteraceae bacterium]